MIVRSVTITPEQIAAAKARMAKGPFVLLNITRSLIDAGVPEENGVAYRAADRLIQVQRKAGLVEFKLKEWAPCQPKT